MKLFFKEIRSIVENARKKTYTAINFDMVEAYWQIGRRIVEEEQKGDARAVYGKGLLKQLSAYLQSEFGQGFSEDNLSNMRRFYLIYRNREKVISVTMSRKSGLHDALVKITLPKKTTIYAKEYRLHLPSKEELRQKLIEWDGR